MDENIDFNMIALSFTGISGSPLTEEAAPINLKDIHLCLGKKLRS